MATSVKFFWLILTQFTTYVGYYIISIVEIFVTGRARVRDFRTGWWNQASERASKRPSCARSISDTKNECNLFISYILSEHFFSLFRKTSLYLEKMTIKFKK